MPHLPDPPLIQHVLLERPTNLCILLGLLTFTLLIASMRTRNQNLLIATVTTFSCAVIVAGTAALVTTTREHLAHQTQRLINAATNLDKATLLQLLHPDLELLGPNGDTWASRDEITTAIDRINHRNVIHSQSAVSIRAHVPTDQLGQTLLNLRTTIQTDLGERPFKTAWFITWTYDTDENQWSATQVQWLPHPALDGIKPSKPLLRAR